MSAEPVSQGSEPFGRAGAVPAGTRPRLGRSRGHQRRWLATLARWIGRQLLPRYFRLQVFGTEHVPLTGPVLLAGNHTSFLDGPLVFVVSPRTAVFYIKEEMYDGPVARPLDWLGQ